MFGLFVIGIISLLIGIGFAVLKVSDAKVKKLKAPVTALAVLFGVVLAVISCIRTVPTGHTGIVTSFGRVENYTYEAGINFSAPWMSVINMDNRNQKKTIDLKCFSSDIQEVDVTYSLNYQISKANAQDIYREIGANYYETVINPRIQEAVRSVMAHYTAEELLEKRSNLSEEIKGILIEKLDTYNIEVLDTSLENLDFSDAFTDAVEAKQVAAQNKLKAETEQEQANMEAEKAAERAKINAQAAADGAGRW